MENNFGIFSVLYIALGIEVMVIMGIIIFTKIPKNLKFQKMNLKDSFNTFLHNKRYKQGVMAQAFYEGAQIFCWTYIFQYLDYMYENLSGTDKINPTWFNVAAIVSFLI
jgi:FHS family L-fucose permease-like MFS transporter